MPVARSIAWRIASCVLLLGLVACGRASRGGGEATSAPRDPDGQAAAFASTKLDELVAEVDRAQQGYASALAGDDVAELARARFALAEAHSGAALDLWEVLYDLDEQRTADPTQRSELDLREAELRAQQRAWFDAAALGYAEVIRIDDPAAVELRPRAQYGLSWTERERGNPAAMHDALVALLHDHPEHPLASPALLTLGDEAFEGQRFAEAQALYERAVLLGEDERHYARYKLGWIALNLDDGQTALAHWMHVIREGGADPRQRSLVETAAMDCVLAYARVGRPELARELFIRIDPSRAAAMLQRLVEIYQREGRPEDAARALGTAP
jgi:tetratricopeptide (TPR) repeat protein